MSWTTSNGQYGNFQGYNTQYTSFTPTPKFDSNYYNQNSVVQTYSNQSGNMYNNQYYNAPGAHNDFGPHTSPYNDYEMEKRTVYLKQNKNPQYVMGLLSSIHQTAGLPNIGCTCYMNAVLQCLFNTKKLVEMTYCVDKAVFTRNFVDILISAYQAYQGKSDIYKAIKEFKEGVDDITTNFRGSGQHDAHEFFRFVIEKIGEEMNNSAGKFDKYKEYKPIYKNMSLEYQVIFDKKRFILNQAEEWKNFSDSRENSLIKELFGGMILNEVHCQGCMKTTYTFEDTLDFSFFIPVNCDELKLLFRDFAKMEDIKDYKCETCKYLKKAQRRTTIWKPPKIMVIQLKRFYADGNMQGAIKDKVKFPLKNLDISNYINLQNKDPISNYDLYGMVLHFGSLESGHYTAQNQAILLNVNRVINNEEKGWLYYDDDKISEITMQDMNNLANGSAEPYILFYKKQNM